MQNAKDNKQTANCQKSQKNFCLCCCFLKRKQKSLPAAVTSRCSSCNYPNIYYPFLPLWLLVKLFLGKTTKTKKTNRRTQLDKTHIRTFQLIKKFCDFLVFIIISISFFSRFLFILMFNIKWKSC